MRFIYGSYSHEEDEVDLISASRVNRFVGGNIPDVMTVSWQIAGILHGSSNADLINKMRIMETAYAVHGAGAVFMQGANVANSIGGLDSIGGCRVVSGPTWVNRFPAEQAGFRSYTITLEADYDYGGSDILEFKETLTFIGDGGPINIWVNPINASVDYEQTAPQSIRRAMQSGTIIGRYDYPPRPNPIWSSPYLRNQEITDSLTSPNRS